MRNVTPSLDSLRFLFASNGLALKTETLIDYKDPGTGKVFDVPVYQAHYFDPYKFQIVTTVSTNSTQEAVYSLALEEALLFDDESTSCS